MRNSISNMYLFAFFSLLLSFNPNQGGEEIVEFFALSKVMV